MAALSSGTRLGTYEILAPLGAGGMGEVYRAKDLRLGREIALKVLPAEVSGNAERLARFEREARTVAGLNHPNIVTLHSVEDDGEVRFLTMELVEGSSLDQSVTPGGLPISRVIDLGIALADALAAAHEKAVVHRDLKPANVMVTKDGRVKVLDFGLAKLATPDSDLGVSQLATMATPISGYGLVAGTVPYMAPEQIRGEAVDARTDLFSLGIVLYELASGARPFRGDTQVEIGSAILKEAPKPLGTMRAGLPAELDRIVSRCLEKNPRERIQSALDVSNEFRRLRRELERSESGAAPRPTSEGIASIAVLPFVNRSASADDEYFSEGLADELLGVLSKVKGLRVIARASSFQFKGRNVPIPEIGKTLDVATVLDGSVRKAGNRVRINVQLVKVSDSSHLWSETYDRTLDDIFAVQDEIAQSVVKELRTTLLGGAADSDASGAAKAEIVRAARGRGTDPEAHRLYLLAKHLIGQYNAADLSRAIQYLEQAVTLDPEYAGAWAELGLAHVRRADLSIGPAAEACAEARKALGHALALEPGLSEAYSRLGWIQMVHEFDFRGAERALARALELSPMSGDALRLAGVLEISWGRLEKATEFYQRALEQDPLSGQIHYGLSNIFCWRGRLDEAIATARRGLELSPNHFGMNLALARALSAAERHAEALVVADRERDDAFRLFGRAIVLHADGRDTESSEALHELIEKFAGDSAFQIACVFATRGEADLAFEWLERARVQRDGGMTMVRVDIPLRSLHGDPRWQPFLKKVGLGD